MLLVLANRCDLYPFNSVSGIKLRMPSSSRSRSGRTLPSQSGNCLRANSAALPSTHSDDQRHTLRAACRPAGFAPDAHRKLRVRMALCGGHKARQFLWARETCGRPAIDNPGARFARQFPPWLLLVLRRNDTGHPANDRFSANFSTGNNTSVSLFAHIRDTMAI